MNDEDYSLAALAARARLRLTNEGNPEYFPDPQPLEHLALDDSIEGGIDLTVWFNDDEEGSERGIRLDRDNVRNLVHDLRCWLDETQE